jgi:hypothetical protein
MTDARLLLGDGAAERRDHAAGLVPRDGRIAAAPDAARVAAARRGAIAVQVAAAHARRLDLEHDLARARRRVLEFHQFKLAVSGKDDTTHRGSSVGFVVRIL